MLAEYITQVQRLLNDRQGQFFDLPTVTEYINMSRRRIAAASACLRCLPEGTQSVPQQERYPFSAWMPLVQGAMPGIESILSVRSFAMAIGPGGWKPLWRFLPWTDFQGRFRIYNRTFIGTISSPGWFSQYGSGPNAELYLAPIPTTAQRIEVDLTLIPSDLVDDDDPEPIPYPWTDAVRFWAATMALLQQQRYQDAQAITALFSALLPECAAVVRPQFIQNPYGATMRSA